MTYNEWRKLYRNIIHTEEYVSLGEDTSTLDGDFSSEELRHIAATMEVMKADTMKPEKT